ncbi:hypothetical protein HDV00_011976 [Rhizophlyctis rosea]|nr:hypothetical protein HDV00_011976 [Rhizophlyctis rosea]
MGFWTPAVKQPALTLLAGAVGLGLGGAFFMMGHILRKDPTVTIAPHTRRNNPHMWLDTPQDKNLKLYAVNQKFDKSNPQIPTY